MGFLELLSFFIPSLSFILLCNSITDKPPIGSSLGVANFALLRITEKIFVGNLRVRVGFVYPAHKNREKYHAVCGNRKTSFFNHVKKNEKFWVF